VLAGWEYIVSEMYKIAGLGGVFTVRFVVDSETLSAGSLTREEGAPAHSFLLLRVTVATSSLNSSCPRHLRPRRGDWIHTPLGGSMNSTLASHRPLMTLPTASRPLPV
jgi:hypothetical protein